MSVRPITRYKVQCLVGDHGWLDFYPERSSDVSVRTIREALQRAERSPTHLTRILALPRGEPFSDPDSWLIVV